MVPFFEAFELQKTEASLIETFKNVYVKNVEISKSKKKAFVYCDSDSFLRFSERKRMEIILKNQVFKDDFSPVLRILFSPASEMSIEELWKMVSEEFYTELKDKNYILYSEYCLEPIQIQNNQIIITCEDSFLTHGNKSSMEDFIRKYFMQQFGIKTAVSFHFSLQCSYNKTGNIPTLKKSELSSGNHNQVSANKTVKGKEK
ncbi:MAG: hypothetical protein LBR68_07150, partial [Lachnoclostridium sp.]|nr:hypothetical protein [Lachnoclostridium sp.]